MPELAEPIITARALGRRGEDVAAEYLKKKKYKIVTRGYRLFRGEIDIIAYDGKTLVFAEVKTRTGAEFGRPEESVTPFKQRQIRKIAQGYLLKEHLNDADCRFDVLSVIITENECRTVTHYKDAF